MTARAQNQANLKEGQNAGRDEYDGLVGRPAVGNAAGGLRPQMRIC